MNRNSSRILGGALVVGLVACSTTVPPLEATFPAPVVENIPASVGVVYDPDLRNFTYNETVSDGTNWTIELGESNMRLFEQLFSSMFSNTVELDDIDDPAAANLDGIIRPVLEEYAFLTPNELGSRFYAVSIRYRIFLYDNAGAEIAVWPVNAYGQSRSSTFDAGMMKVAPLQEATNMAMRDAAAGAIITLRQQPEILGLAGKESNAQDTQD